VKPALKPGWSKIKAIMRLSFPIGISDIFILLNTRADIFMLAWMQSDYAVGIYNAAFRFFDMAVILALTAMNPIIPVFSRLAASDRGRLKRRFTELIELIAVFCVPAAVLAPHVSPALMRLFFGEPFTASADVLNILAWVSVVVFYSLFGSALCLSIGVVNYKYWSAPAAAALNIFINYLLIPSYSFIGSAWATLICEIFLAGATFFFIIRNLGSVFRWRRWLRIAAANAVLFAAAGLMRPLPAAPALGGALFIYAGTCFVLGILSRDAVRRAAGLFNRSGGA
jgi:O-antigen/teichoic acid export membrane protein